MNFKKYQNYQELIRESLDNKESFWREEAKELYWDKFPEQILSQNEKGYYRWYADGVTNITINCLD